MLRPARVASGVAAPKLPPPVTLKSVAGVKLLAQNRSPGLNVCAAAHVDSTANHVPTAIAHLHALDRTVFPPGIAPAHRPCPRCAETESSYVTDVSGNCRPCQVKSLLGEVLFTATTAGARLVALGCGMDAVWVSPTLSSTSSEM